MQKSIPKFLSILKKTVLWLFTFSFAAVLIQILFFNSSFGYSPILQVVLLVLLLAFLCLLGFAAYTQKKWIYAHSNHILAVVLGFIFLVQLYIGFATKQTPTEDYDKVFNGALVFLQYGKTSEEFAPYAQYLHHFTNNSGLFVFFANLFGIMQNIGFTCFYEVAVTIGHLLFTAAIFFTYRYLEKTFSKLTALLSLAFFIIFLPVYFQSSIAYTDTYTIWIAPFILYINTCAKNSSKKSTKIALYISMGIVATIAIQFKPTVLIALVAIVIEQLLASDWRRVAACLAVVLVVGASLNVLVEKYKYSNFLDKSVVDVDSMPVTLWFLMGLSGDGSYNSYDHWTITTQVSTRKARQQLHVEVIKERLQAMGIVGYTQLLHRKTCRTFGSSNADIPHMLVGHPANPSHWIYNIISYDGAFFRYFDNLSQVIYLSFLFLGVCGAFLLLRKKDEHILENTAPYISLFGFLLFMMLWESNHRQLVNQWPLFIIVAAVGAAVLLSSLCKALSTKFKGKNTHAKKLQQ